MTAIAAAASTEATAKLSEFDFIVCIDKSGSMSEPVKAGSVKSRWEAVQESALAMIRDVEKLDSDGLGLVVFGGGGAFAYDGVTADKAREIFTQHSPRGSTPLHEALHEAFALAGKSDKKAFVIVFTDGAPDDKAAAAQRIIEQANSQETDDACTVLFIQVGDDAGATAYLKELDDALDGAKFDIVDAKTVAEADAFPTTTALVLAAIDD